MFDVSLHPLALPSTSKAKEGLAVRTMALAMVKPATKRENGVVRPTNAMVFSTVSMIEYGGGIFSMYCAIYQGFSNMSGGFEKKNPHIKEGYDSVKGPHRYGPTDNWNVAEKVFMGVGKLWYNRRIEGFPESMYFSENGR